MKLRYIGPERSHGGSLPLPEGWPAADHDEPDAALAAEKLRPVSIKVVHRQPDGEFER